MKTIAIANFKGGATFCKPARPESYGKELTGMAQRFTMWLQFPDPEKFGAAFRVGDPAPVSGMDTAPEWQTGAPPKSGYYAARLEFFGKPLASPRVIWWDEGAWYNAVGDDICQRKLDSQIRVVGWWPLPKQN